ncbi:MAG: RsmE family RNA methyltransferase [Patescibacteria group bacterium]|jgi:16S rRNA (uracil1498-N3)-methyltransferase
MLPRFYQAQVNIKNDRLTINDRQIVYQLTKILHLKKDDLFIIFTPQAEYQLALIQTDGKTVQTAVIETSKPSREPKKKLTLYQSLLKKDKFEWILQKAVELGVQTVVPVVSDNSIVREISANKQGRYQKIIQEATEQCGGLNLCHLEKTVDFSQAVSQAAKNPGQKIIAWEGEGKNKLAGIIDPQISEYHLFIGPEGGFSPQEIDLAKTNNIQIVSLGKRILRAETAAIAALAVILLS